MNTQMPKRKKKFSFWKFILYLVLLLMAAALVRYYLMGDSALPDALSSYDRQSFTEHSHDKVYDSICTGVSDCRSTVSLFTTTKATKIADIYSEVIADHPEIFWEKGATIKQFRILFLSYSLIHNDFLCSSTSIPSMKQQMDKEIDSIVSEAQQYETDRDKALFVHDRLVDICSYDEELYESGESASLSYTCYGCLVEHKAVCQGYAEAYKLILDRLGIPCGLIMGTAKSTLGTGSHAWNYIVLDGTYYMVDVTWDDPLNYHGPVLHDYFCLSPDQMKTDHFAESGWPPLDWSA